MNFLHPIIDNHVHLFREDQMDQLLRDLDASGAEKFCMLITGRDMYDPTGEQFRLAKLLQQRRPDKVFVFGGLDFTGMFDRHASNPDIPFETQLKQLIDSGYDGLKLLCGKPDHRHNINAALDSALFKPMLDLLEETGFPVLWHVSDPPEFWSEQTVPLWAKARGWWYPAGTPSKTQIDSEITNVMRHHPKLRLIRPHFAFSADHLEHLSTMLDQYPNLMLDLAPGIEMYHHFTIHYEQTRVFFNRYANRILYGSDTGLPCGWHQDRPTFILKFLTTTDELTPPNDPCFQPDDRPNVRGIGLNVDQVQQITHDNFVRFVGVSPRGII